MRILSIPTPAPETAATPAASPHVIPVSSAPSESPNLERVEALEKVASALLQKLQDVEARVESLAERPQPAPAPIPAAEEASIIPISVDTDAVKKGLDKMWKYLNDEHSPRTI